MIIHQQLLLKIYLAVSPFKGKSPFDITGICNSSQGITTSKHKLGRGIPSEVDMDGSKLNSIDDIIQLGIEAKAMPGC